jgi:hypothetical protein
MTTVAIRLACAALAGAAPFLASSVAAAPLPPIREVYELLEKAPPGLDAEALNRAALVGLVQELEGRLVVPGLEVEGSTDTNVVAKAQVIDRDFGWVRLARIDGTTPAALEEAVSKLVASNRIRGLILDLRETNGRDYGAAGAIADRFFSTEQPLLSWADGKAASSAKSTAYLFPVSILVNGRTRGAAEALAAVLRRGHVGLVLGETTSGQARVMEERRLPSGQSVWVAGDAVKLGNGDSLDQPVQPDIAVPVDRALEREWLENPFKRLVSAGTGAPDASSRPRRRLNEATLVRQQRENGFIGDLPEFAPAPDSDGPPAATLQDPALARALDLIKGLAVVQPRRNG